MNKYSATLIFLVIILIAALSYFIVQNQKLASKLTNQTPSTPSPQTIASPSPTSTPAASPSPTMTLSQLQENIEASVNSKNFAALASYMTKPEVNFSLMSSECCPPMTPDEAVTQMNYISDGIPLDFNQQSETVANLKSKNPQLASTFIGVSKTKEHLAAFTINNQNRIAEVQLAITWKLYDY